MGGSSGGGGSSSSGGTYTMRYADYIEVRHNEFLQTTAFYRQNLIPNNNPYGAYIDIPVDDGFFGAGYVLASFPALFDIYGKFVAGLDIEALWDQIYASTIDSPQTVTLVNAESMLLDDELESSILPKFMTGMRDLNAVMSSTFVIGKALLYDTKQKLISKFSAELKWKLITIAQDRWKAHLAWNTETVTSYARIFDLYFSAKNNITKMNFEYHAKNSLWAMEVLDYERANLGALQGAMKQTNSASSGGSSGGSVLGGALSGAAAGGMMTGGNPIGIAGGAILGGIAGLL